MIWKCWEWFCEKSKKLNLLRRVPKKNHFNAYLHDFVPTRPSPTCNQHDAKSLQALANAMIQKLKCQHPNTKYTHAEMQANLVFKEVHVLCSKFYGSSEFSYMINVQNHEISPKTRTELLSLKRKKKLIFSLTYKTELSSI